MDRVLSVVFVLMVTLQSLPCSPLPQACSVPAGPGPEECSYETIKDQCGNEVCPRGPGDMCGGKYGRYGTCADGLMCSNCNRCQGCSFSTFICWEDKNCIY